MIEKVFVDTNLFIRYLVNDQPEMVKKVENLLDKAEKGKVNLFTGPPVFFELAWTLKSFYKKPREYIHECLLSILGIQGLTTFDSDVVEEALEIFRSNNIDFGDAYIIAISKANKLNFIATFNRKHFKNSFLKLYDL